MKGFNSLLFTVRGYKTGGTVGASVRSYKAGGVAGSGVVASPPARAVGSS